MILAIDIGNTNIVLGTYQEERLVFVSRIRTESEKTEDEYGVLIRSILRLHYQEPREITAVIISSVVPPLTAAMKRAANLLCSTATVLVVGPGVKTGLDIRIDNPAQLGADLVSTSIGVLEKYPVPAITIDLGTATKICMIDQNRSFRGCSIMPGVGIALEALSKRTAQLPSISLEGDDIKLVGTNSIDSMRSGVVLGAASMLDGMISRLEEEYGSFATIVACGGVVNAIVPHCKHNITIDPTLLLDGLYAIYRKNVK
ncbi:MAG: type III pantothenate kinase [Angelakisella sp.]